MVLGVGYSTGYTTLMTWPLLEPPINTLQDLVDNSNHAPDIQRHLYVIHF